MTYVTAPRLIAYAGQEGFPTPRDMSAYTMFRMGLDTAQIAARLGIPEHVVVKRITLSRDAAHGTETVFERRGRS